VYENVFFCVGTINKTISRFNIEPFDDASLGSAHGDVPIESVDENKATVQAHAQHGQKHSRNVEPGVQT